MRTKTLYRRDGERIGISRFPNFHKSGSIAGMSIFTSLIISDYSF